MTRPHIVEFDVMRAVAASAVVVVHSLGPYRERLGEIADAHWASAIALNGALRWSVPLFIMITGALMLVDSRPLSMPYFLRRRILKVVLPFLAFSVLYAVLAGVSPAGFDASVTLDALEQLPVHESYYHLGFFYYFIPLYVVLMVLRPTIRFPGLAIAIVVTWLALTALRLAGFSGFWSAEILLFGGYLMLGWVLWRYRWPPLIILAPVAVLALLLSDWMVITNSLDAGRYRTGLWFSYKTINIVCLAAAVFVVCIRLTPLLSTRAQLAFRTVGQHSLGIYLLHPLFLWPARAFDLYAGHPIPAILFWAAVSGSLAFGMSILLSRSVLTRWLVP